MRHDPSDRLDVLLVVGDFQLRGSYARSLSLMERLPRDRIQLRILATDPIRSGQGELGQLDVRMSRYLHWPLLYRAARHFLKTDLRDAPPALIDVQHRHMLPIGAWLASQLECPYVVTVHDYLRDRERFTVDLQWCRRIVAVSESVRTELLERTSLPDGMVQVIPSGVLPPESSELPSVLDPGRCPVIGTAGPLEAEKGLRVFLQAAARVLRKFPETMFVIAGSGPEERSLRLLSSSLGIRHAVTFLPNLHNFGPALQAMDVFVLAALKQGLGATMLEAMARGLPVIGTESGGVHSVITDKVTGLLVPPADEAALADSMCQLLSDPAQARSLGQAARQRVLDHFHVNKMIEATMALYEDVLSSDVPAQRKKTLI